MTIGGSMKREIMLTVVAGCSVILMSCLADYPPTQTGGAPEGFGPVPTQAEVEICAKFAQDQTISMPAESSQDATGERAGTGGSMDTRPAPTPREGKSTAQSTEYKRAYQDCMSKRGY